MIKTTEIVKKVKETVLYISSNVDEKTCALLLEAEKRESSELSRFTLGIMNENLSFARESGIPACQDTGMVIVFASVGDKCRIDGNLYKAIDEGVRQGYVTLRKSVLDPVTRKNTGDNTPAVVYTELVEGIGLKLDIMAKGFGSENMSTLTMLNPSDGKNGIIKAATDTVRRAGSCPCPPVILGIGIGGTMDKAAVLSKKALFRSLGSANSDNELNELEKIILDQLNALNIGAGGFGGNTTALAVFIEKYPTHIAGLPVAVTVCCHSNRHKSVYFSES